MRMRIHLPEGIYRAAVIVLSLFLLTAALLKAWALVTDPLVADPVFGSPTVLALVMLVESGVGFWLLWGGWPRLARIVVSLLFLVFAGASLYLAAFAKTSTCGCLGNIPVSPWLAFGFDVAVLLFLHLVMPNNQVFYQINLDGLFGRALALVGGTGVLLAFCFTILTLLNGSVYEGLARLRGEKVSVRPPVTDVGEGMLGENRAFTVTLYNHGHSPIRVSGGTSNCSCVAIRNLPAIIPGHQELPVEVGVSYTGREGAFEKGFLFYLEDESQSYAVGRLKGRILSTE